MSSAAAAELARIAAARDPVGAERLSLAGWERRPQRAPIRNGKPPDPAKPCTIVILGDPHTDPDAPNDRFDWLGNYIESERPEVIVEMGDFASLSSLGHFDRGTTRGFAQRYREEVLHAWDALERIQRGIQRAQRREQKYSPYRVAIAGNHDHERYLRLHNADPRFIGTIGHEDLGFGTYGWAWSPFLTWAEVQGWGLSHYATAGNSGRALARKHHAAGLTETQLGPTIVGHNHLLDIRYTTRRTGQRWLSASAGCFFSHDEPWAGQDNRRWSRGMLVLHDARDGDADAEWISLERLRRLWG